MITASSLPIGEDLHRDFQKIWMYCNNPFILGRTNEIPSTAPGAYFLKANFVGRIRVANDPRNPLKPLNVPKNYFYPLKCPLIFTKHQYPLKVLKNSPKSLKNPDYCCPKFKIGLF